MARSWPWELASIIAAGVSEIVRQVQKRHFTALAYPASSAPEDSNSSSDSSSSSSSDSDGVSSVEELEEEEMTDPEVTEGPRARRLPPMTVTCEACKAGLGKLDGNHTRIPWECKWPKCKACQFGRHMDHDNHTRIEGECRLHGIEPIVWWCVGCRRNNHRHLMTNGVPDYVSVEEDP